MKLKEIQRTSTIAWSPIQSLQAIATGTVSGALDESFSNTTELEIFKLDWSLANTAELKPIGVVTSNARFNRLAWSLPTGDYNSGVIAGGMENGEIDFWNPAKILEGSSSEESLISRQTNHTGAVKGLEFNPSQANLLASGAGNGEVFIWNLGDLSKPYSPGPKSQKLGDITCLSWNKKVHHILATSSTSGYTVIWDLRNRREVMSLGYQPSNNMNFGGMSRNGVTAVSWNPDSATQLVTASEDDNNPVILSWDLRNANAPEKIFSGHSKGVLSLDWCPMDSDLLLSCGKDNRNICWNPKTGDILGELPQSHNWAFDIQWSPRNPNILSSCSYDGKIAIYSILSSEEEKQAAAAAEANDDPFSPNIPASGSLALKQPPKWFRRPVGATFGFGGQLAYFLPNMQGVRTVSITNVASDPSISERIHELESALEGPTADEFISKKSNQSAENKSSWDAIKLLFEEDSRKKLVDMLSSKNNLSAELINESLTKLNLNKDIIDETPAEPEVVENKVVETEGKVDEEVADKLNEGTDLFGAEGSKAEDDFFSKATQESKIKEAIETTTVKEGTDPFSIDDGSSELQSLLSKLIVVGDFKNAVKACLNSNQYADALLVAMVGGKDLLESTKRQIFKLRRGEASYVRLLENVVDGNLEDIVLNVDIKEWDKILTMICTYAQGEEFSLLSEKLGVRLYQSSDLEDSKQNALLCFLLAGNVEKVINIWISESLEKHDSLSDKKQVNHNQLISNVEQLTTNPDVLQELIEKVLLFIKAIQFADPNSQLGYQENENQEITDPSLAVLYALYFGYAEFLASQGLLELAAKYLNRIPSVFKKASPSALDEYAALKYRLYYAGANIETFDPNYFPFNYNEIGGTSYQESTQTYPDTQQTQNTTSYPNQYDNYGSQQAYQQTSQQAYYGNDYQQYPQTTNQSQNQLYNPAGPTQTPAQDISSLYNPYPNYPPASSALPYPTYSANNTSYYPSPSAQSTQEPVVPPSAKRGGPGWNDPPTEVFSSKQAANKPQAKPAVISSPFGAPSPPSMPPLNQQAQPSYTEPGKNLPPPPQGGRAPAPLYTRKEHNTTNSGSQQMPQAGQAFVNNLPQGGQSFNQHIGFQNPQQSVPTQNQPQRPPPQASQPPQKPLYQTNPVKPTHTPPRPAPTQRMPGHPSQPPPGRGPGPMPNQAQGPPTGFSRPPQPQSSQPPQVPQQQATPPKSQPVVIDRSKMPPKYKPLFDGLSKEIASLKSSGLPPAQSRMFADVEKKLSQFFDAMNLDQLAPSLLEPLNEIGKAIESKDFPRAMSLHTQLVSTQVDKVGPWVAGIKHLITLLRSKP